MNFVPFKLGTKRKEKKEVINSNKMEEEERELINLINNMWEEMVLLPSGAKWDRMEEGAQVPPGSLALVTCLGVLPCSWPPTGHGLLTGVLALASPRKYLGWSRECSKSGKHPADPVSREREVQILR